MHRKDSVTIREHVQKVLHSRLTETDNYAVFSTGVTNSKVKLEKAPIGVWTGCGVSVPVCIS